MVPPEPCSGRSEPVPIRRDHSSVGVTELRATRGNDPADPVEELHLVERGGWIFSTEIHHLRL